MQQFETGKVYALLGIPLWMRGRVVREDMRYIWLEDAEYLPDAPNMTAYTRTDIRGEKLPKQVQVGIHKDTVNVILGPLDEQ